MKAFTAALATAALWVSSVVANNDPIVIKGSKFFYKSNGAEFFIQGVAYQQEVGVAGSTTNATYVDPLADTDRCLVDIPLMKALNMNTIRVYAIDPTKDHSKCMQALLDNDMYLVLDLGEPALSINREQPAWNNQLFQRYASVIDAVAKYPNVIGFFAGNEVSNNNTNTGASAFVKAAVRDMKKYIKDKNYRTMGVGYATNDDAEIRENLANYFNCGNPDEAIDFWGYNIYSWCGDSNYQLSGYADRVKEFSTYSVPSFFAEYGCNTVQPRKFSEVSTLYGSDMTKVFSGGIVYMYFEEANNYGLVDVRTGSLQKLQDYSALQSQMSQISPSGVNMNSYNPTNTPAACPAVKAGGWGAASSPLPAMANTQLCSCMYDSLSCTVKSSVSEESYGKLFNSVCGYGSSCAGIVANATTGKYGAYSVCNANQQLSFAMDQYYKSQKSASSACDFGGAASLKTASSANSQCSGLLSQAGTDGTKQISSSSTSSSTTGSGNKTSAATTAVSVSFVAYISAVVMLGASIFIL